MYFFIRNKLWPYVNPFKKKVLLVAFLSFLLAAIGGLQVKLIQPIFDNGLSPKASLNEILTLAFYLFFLALLNFPCRFFHFYLLRLVVEKITLKIRQDMFHKIQKLPISYFTQSKHGDLLSHIINDSQVFSQGLRAVVDLLREPLKAIVFLGMAFYSDWQLTLAIFILAPFLIQIFKKTGLLVKKNQSSIQKAFGELSHNVSEGIQSQKITKAFNLQEFIEKRFLNSQIRLFDNQMATTKVEELAHPLVELIGGMAFAGTIIFAYYRIRSEATTVGEFMSFIAALALFMDPVRKFSQANIKISQAYAASERIFALLSLQEEKDFGKLDPSSFREKIEIKNLSFSYGDKDVLKNVSFEILKGEKVAIVGPSGSGKSSLLNLFLGLYPIENGDIFIDHQSIKTMSLEGLRKLFALVNQEIFLFHDTIRENLSVGRSFSSEELKMALEVSHSEDFIHQLPLKMETVLGDSGLRLSGGQRQRITIARAFLQNSDILLFDEATSSLDNESEKIVQEALEKIANDKTVVAVAHRLTTIQGYDKIIVMREGKIIEIGNHEELINKKGEYYKLYNLSALS